MRGKKCVLILTLTLLLGAIIPSVPPVKSDPYETRLHVRQSPPGSNMSGVDVDAYIWVTFDIETPDAWSETENGIVGWVFSVRVNPNVLTPWSARTATYDYFLYEWCDDKGWTNYTLSPPPTKNASDFIEFGEMMVGSPPLGLVGAGGSSYAGSTYGSVGGLGELRFKSKSKTAYTKIDIYDAYWVDINETIHAFDVVDDGHYNAPTHLHSQSGLINLASPEGTGWHEIYPTFCTNYTLDYWEDNDDGVLGHCDQIGMTDTDTTDWVWFHVDRITVTIFTFATVGGKDYEMYWEFNGTYEAALEGDPTGEQWYEIYRTKDGVPQSTYGSSQPVIDFDDDDADGNVTVGDRLKTTCDLGSKWWPVSEIGTDIIVSYKWPQPPYWPEFPLGLALEIGLIVAIAYVWWSRRKTKITKKTKLAY